MLHYSFFSIQLLIRGSTGVLLYVGSPCVSAQSLTMDVRKEQTRVLLLTTIPSLNYCDPISQWLQH